MSDSCERLLEIVAGRNHWERVEAIAALGARRDRRAIAVLVELLDDAKECRHTKTEAVQALARLGAVDAEPVLMKTLEDDDDVEVRTHAARALGALRLVGAAKLLRRITEREKDGDLVAAARQALEQLSLRAVP